MNTLPTTRVKTLPTKIIIFIVSYCLIVWTSYANSAKDKELIIVVDPVSHCAVNVVPSDNESNCAILYPVGKNPCKNDAECVCSQKEKYISWRTSNADEFNIHFTDGSPFKRCQYRAERGEKLRCKIKNKGDYYYEVNVKGCATNPYDPRIVVQ
ncbi:hypothetical protein SAMN05216262_1056 [Colwellia chukchiensis]|uniref:Uncharacterized protein n=1 Tax=Colwellia chukchiensis TaxID=641665 RepID=A0A1H7LWU1_9GAMM|nr:hypothetical protein [Colwellia chukchiensis]SEL02777.1 hypothetical protein SAMN05216262_1056 [Colwellia chukchiensis]